MPETRIREILNRVLPGRGSADRVNRRREDFINQLVDLVWLQRRPNRRMAREEIARFRHEIQENYGGPMVQPGLGTRRLPGRVLCDAVRSG